MPEPGPFADLPGITVETTRDRWLPGQAVVRVEQQMPATNPPARSKLTGVIAVPTELLNDSAIPLTQLIEAQMDRAFRPWRYPDPNPFPQMDRLVAPVMTWFVGTRPGRWMLRRRPVRRLIYISDR